MRYVAENNLKAITLRKIFNTELIKSVIKLIGSKTSVKKI